MPDKIIVANKFYSPESFIKRLLQKEPAIIFTKNEKDIFELLNNNNPAIGNTLVILTDLFNIRDILSVANPVTKLPGNNVACAVINERLRKPGVQIAVLYADIDNFKAYNDKYGFERGDKVLKKTAAIISKIIAVIGNKNDFVGHLGGDDFIFVSTPDKAEILANSVCHKFDQEIIKHYDKDDQKIKKITTTNRQGKEEEFPIMTLSISIITNENINLTSVGQVSHIAAQLKNYAKTKPNGPGSNFVKERRKNEKSIGPACL